MISNLYLVVDFAEEPILEKSRISAKTVRSPLQLSLNYEVTNFAIQMIKVCFVKYAEKGLVMWKTLSITCGVTTVRRQV